MVYILGLDPGLRHTGWGVISIQGNRLSHVAHGVIDAEQEGELAYRLQDLFYKLTQVIEQYPIDEAAVEETFVNKNPTSTLKLGMARGVVLLVPALRHISVHEYSANRVKKSVVGVGHASKGQVTTMVQYFLPVLKEGNIRPDAADALAVAICHSHFRGQPVF
jgi:crossover junction endodeoxyribonuclease RuvC